MRFLSSQSMHLLHDLLPEVNHVICSRVVNHLSFYLSHNGAYLYYSPHLRHLKNLSQIFRGASSKINNLK